ncbi:M1 family aminopeptidase [Nocardioides sp. Arc9.136]|uniref:M1 family aminopeptidase n=1 Tax=Nocardioides sp. Arc9.136 TaxID=2996826 RepID=UPI002666FD0F|nr:M1 family aminopeptidase [Nocardioides sp. Arc9.136]WKN48034.1 M1 family aminopeptidase [Nocardioides sp. Arc9.136]
MTTTPRSALRRATGWTLGTLLATGALTALPPAPAASAAEPIDGAHSAGDSLFPHVGNGGYDAQHYDVQLAWTPGATLAASTIRATTTMTATAAVPLRSFSMDLEGLTVESVQVNGAPATFTRDIDAAAIKYKLVVTPSAPVEGGFTTTVTYSGVPTRHVDADGSFEGWNVTSDGATFLNQPIGAMTGFPHNNTPADKATYRFALDIPSTITNAAGTGAAAAGSNGELVSRTPSSDGSRTTWVWDQSEPMASELAMITIGKYDVLESDVTVSGGRVLHEWSFVDSALSASAKATINTRRASLGAIITGLESIYGPYPGNSVGVVVDTVPREISYALETQDRSFFPGSISANTLVHEVAHQWFGNAVSPRDWNDLFINEGMATWAPTYYNNVVAKTSATTTESTYFSSWNTKAASSADWAIPPAGMTDPATLYEYQSYTRGAQMWEALKTAIGDPAFFRFVRTWQDRYTGQSRGFSAFEALAEEVSGRDLTAFFQDWVLDADKPAWPEKVGLGLTSAPAPAEVDRGDAIDYTLTAQNTGRVPLATAVASVDLADLLDDATLDVAALPSDLALSGTTLTWTVPPTALAGTATTGFRVRVDDDASSATLTATARVDTLGGTCAACTTAHTIGVEPLAPAPVPTVDGAAVVGQTLTAGTAGWASGSGFAYQWQVAGVDVPGATTASYVVRPSDLGRTITVVVTGSKVGYSPVTQVSAPTSAVQPGVLSAPVPTISGTPAVGSPLTASAGGSGYQWYVGGRPVPGATSSTYVPVAGDVGRTVSVLLLVDVSGYLGAGARSAETAPVALGTLEPTPLPTIGGDAVVGGTLSASAGPWADGVALSYRWSVGGAVVDGATGATYRPTAQDLGRAVTVTVTGTRAGYTSVTRTSAPTATVARGTLAGAGRPSIVGAPKVRRTLTAETGDWPAGTTVAFRWYVGGKAVRGATGPTLQLVRAFRGKRVKVEVTASKPGYTTIVVRSRATARVR